MKKIRAAVVGYGNIGHYAIEALEAAKDFEIAGIVRRQGDKDKPLELTPYDVVDDIAKLKNVDVAILAAPTRSCPEYAERIVAMGINTVDSFDIHTSILDYRTKQMENCKKAGKVSVIAAGTQRVVVHQLRARYVDGTLCLRAWQGRCEERTFCNYPAGRRHSSPYGLRGIGRRRKARRGYKGYQG